jgi:hypothetical protein
MLTRCKYKVILIWIFLIIVSYAVNAAENPKDLFEKLSILYIKSDAAYEYKELESNLDDGSDFWIYNSDKKTSKDIFCQVTLLATMGQTQYLCYQKEGETIWYIEKKAMIYDRPYTFEDAEIEKTYFSYENEKTLVYNDETNKYDIEKDSGDFIAIADFDRIMDLIDLVERNL